MSSIYGGSVLCMTKYFVYQNIFLFAHFRAFLANNSAWSQHFYLGFFFCFCTNIWSWMLQELKFCSEVHFFYCRMLFLLLQNPEMVLQKAHCQFHHWSAVIRNKRTVCGVLTQKLTRVFLLRFKLWDLHFQNATSLACLQIWYLIHRLGIRSVYSTFSPKVEILFFSLPESSQWHPC